MKLVEFLTMVRGHWNYMVSTIILLENILTILRCEYSKTLRTQDLFIHLRISLALIIIFINEVKKSSLIFVIFQPDFQKSIFICCCTHSISFLVFFLNILLQPELFINISWFDHLLKIVFYGNLLLNSMSFILLTMLLILANLFIIFFPNLRQ